MRGYGNQATSPGPLPPERGKGSFFLRFRSMLTLPDFGVGSRGAIVQ